MYVLSVQISKAEFKIDDNVKLSIADLKELQTSIDEAICKCVKNKFDEVIFPDIYVDVCLVDIPF